jgi:hypothetical protein
MRFSAMEYDRNNQPTRFVDVLDDDVVAALAVRVVLPLAAPLALAFTAVLVEEVVFYSMFR